MIRFRYVARAADGRQVDGERQARSRTELLGELRAEGLLLLRLEESAEARRTSGPSLLTRLDMALRPARSIDIEAGLHQLAFLQRSGVLLVQAIGLCALQAPRPAVVALWRRIAERIQHGARFSVALGDERCCSRLVVALAAVGEETGTLERVLDRAVATLSRRREVIASMVTALVYPAIVVVMAIVVVIYLMVGLIPRLQVFLAARGRTLPATTQLLIDISAFVRLHGATICALVAVAGITVLILHRLPGPGRAIDRLLLRLPIFGTLQRLGVTATFARTMATLLDSGVRLTAALEMVLPLYRNRVVTGTIAHARMRVLGGSPLAPHLAESPAFMPILAAMTAVGESAGRLEEVLREVAIYHEARLEALIRRLIALLEPVLILVVGGIVGFVYLSFFMAIYSIVGKR